MRKLVAVWALLFICLTLTSCTSSRPEDAFLGSWKGIHEGETVLVEFLKPDIIIVKADSETTAGTWTLDADGNAQLVGPDTDDKAVATPTEDGRLIIRGAGGAGVLEKVDKKKDK